MPKWSGRRMTYYNPGEAPQPSGKGRAKVPGLPTGNSRPQRRQRAKLPFLQQAKLAERMGFPIPDRYPDGTVAQQQWIDKWEAHYANQK